MYCIKSKLWWMILFINSCTTWGGMYNISLYSVWCRFYLNLSIHAKPASCRSRKCIPMFLYCAGIDDDKMYEFLYFMREKHRLILFSLENAASALGLLTLLRYNLIQYKYLLQGMVLFLYRSKCFTSGHPSSTTGPGSLPILSPSA